MATVTYQCKKKNTLEVQAREISREDTKLLAKLNTGADDNWISKKAVKK